MSESSVVVDLKNLKSNDPEFRLSAVINLRRYLVSNPKEFRVRMVRKSIQTMIKDNDDQVREAVLITLIETGREDPKLLVPLVLSILTEPQDPNPGIRSLALEWLSEQGHSSLQDFTIKALNDPNKAILNTALGIVTKHQISGVEPILLRLLGTETGGLRRAVIYALGRVKTPQAIGTLIQIMRDAGYDDLTRNQASSALEKLGRLGKEVIIPFIENLADSNDYVRETAAAFLKKNESEIITAVMGQGRLDLLALLHHGTLSTKQNFGTVVSALKTQMSFAIQDLRNRISSREQFHYSELAAEYQSTKIAIKIMVEDLLEIQFFPLTDGVYLTEVGLKKLFQAEFDQFNVIQLPILQQRSPFNEIGKEMLVSVLSSFPDIHQVSSELYITKAFQTQVTTSIQSIGFLSVSDLSNQTNLSPELITNVILPEIYPANEGWLNSQQEFITPRFIKQKWSETLAHYKIQAFEKFLHDELSSPQIEFRIFRELTEGTQLGRWLEDIQVFIDQVELENLERDIGNIDETRVEHLLPVIGINYSRFLDSLVKTLNIQVFRTDIGKVVTLKNILEAIRVQFQAQGYVDLEQFKHEQGLTKTSAEVSPPISDYLLQNYVGRQDKGNKYFIQEELITRIQKEINTHPRVNFDVLAFKLEIPSSLLPVIVDDILQLSGITNSVGEFITERGIQQEINGILEHRQELALEELGEILDVNDDQWELINQLIDRDEKLLRTKDRRVLTLKGAAGKVLYFINRPEQQTKELIRWEEFAILNFPRDLIQRMVTSMVQNKMLPGSMNSSGYRL